MKKDPSEYHSDNIFEIQFDDEVDTIFSEYGDFFATDDADYEFPEDAQKRYELFKDSTGKYHFYDIKRKYLIQAAREDDADSIKAELIEIDKVVNNPKLFSETDRLQLFKAAKEYFATAKVLGPVEEKGNSYTEEVTLYIYCLHKQNYFNHYLLPEKAFSIDNKSTEFLAEVYGRYFLFYEYLLEQAAKLGIEINISINIKKAQEKPKTKKQQNKDKTLRQIWEGSDTDWNKTFDFLQKPFPGDQLVWVAISKNGEYNWTRIGRKPFQKYLAGFIKVCIEHGYINNEYSGPEMASICCNTFKNLAGLERNNFVNLNYYSDKDPYQQPFLDIFKKKTKK